MVAQFYPRLIKPFLYKSFLTLGASFLDTDFKVLVATSPIWLSLDKFISSISLYKSKSK